MKYSNLKVGLKVAVKDGATCHWFSPYRGCEGVVLEHDATSDNDWLGVRVEFGDYSVWGDHKDLKCLKKDIV
jgi:hypothetical protein